MNAFLRSRISAVLPAKAPSCYSFPDEESGDMLRVRKKLVSCPPIWTRQLAFGRRSSVVVLSCLPTTIF